MELYCCGFAFDYKREHVLLIIKNRPQWQAGKANGVGGKIEEGEAPEKAMAREFLEEAEVAIAPEHWKLHVILGVSDVAKVYFYSTVMSNLTLSHLEGKVNDVREQFFVCNADSLPENVIPNLKWLVPLIARDQVETPISIREFQRGG